MSGQVSSRGRFSQVRSACPLADPDRAVEDHGLAAVQRRRVADPRRRQFRAGREVELLQGDLLLEPRPPQPSGQGQRSAAGELVLAEHLQVRRFFRGSGDARSGPSPNRSLVATLSAHAWERHARRQAALSRRTRRGPLPTLDRKRVPAHRHRRTGRDRTSPWVTRRRPSSLTWPLLSDLDSNEEPLRLTPECSSS